MEQVLWFDEQEIDIGEEIHARIQEALSGSNVAVLLLSNYFFTSDYITRHELPYLLQHARQKSLRFAPLYVTAIPDLAFKVSVEIDGQRSAVDLKDYLGAHSPNEPLNTLDRGERDRIYARLVNSITQLQSVNVSTDLTARPIGPRFELGIALRARGEHWEHRFSLPHTADFARPLLNCPTPEMIFSSPPYAVDGEDLFQVLFGSDGRTSGTILGAAFGGIQTADPTRYPLRLHLLTDDERLCALPWATVAYQGRRLARDGWTVELHHDSAAGFPEYPLHTCAFPGQVVLIGTSAGGDIPQDVAHLGGMCSAFFSAAGNRRRNPSW